jgi:2Fe-2S iron-sulfur cluster binding domain
MRVAVPIIETTVPQKRLCLETHAYRTHLAAASPFVLWRTLISVSVRLPRALDAKYSAPASTLTVLAAVEYIRDTQSPDLWSRANCRTGQCGICAMRINGNLQLACVTPVQDDDLIEPLTNGPGYLYGLVCDISFRYHDYFRRSGAGATELAEKRVFEFLLTHEA